MKTQPAVIRLAATVLTGSLVASDSVDVRSATRVSAEFIYTKGPAATLLEIHPEVSFDDGTTWSPAVAALSTGTPGSGLVQIEALDPTYTITITGNRVLHWEVWGAQRFRVRVRETGTPAGTCLITANATRGE